MHLLHSSPMRTLASGSTTNPVSILKSASAIVQSSHAYTTTPATPSTRPHTTPNTIRRNYFSTSLPFIPIRHASTTTDIPSSAPQTNLNWNEFLRLRRIRRFYNLGGSVITGFCGVLLSASLIANQDVAGYGQQLTGLDPVVIMGAWTMGFGGAGWLIGPVMGTAVFGMIYRRFGTQMRMKERDFFDRIRKYRVDPTSSSMQNPVPDYYGEKITSVAGYRRWLKDQRAFNKKRQSFV